MVDDIGEIGHGLMAFVYGDLEGRRGDVAIDGVNGSLPAAC